ncbi:MAG: flavin reductase family protein [Firmicutes bacterium]|nr:flavin reductase family protein [Bacillota bacterium]
MDKINIGKTAFINPMPVVIAGTHSNEKPNFMAVGWISSVNLNPPLIAIGIGSHRCTAKGIEESGEFSICVPDASLLEKTDYVGVVSGNKVDKSGVFDLFYGELKKAPMIRECPICMECRLYQTVKLPTHTMFIGEIMGTYTEEKYLTDGKPNLTKINPFTLTMPDNNYWSMGDPIGKAWNIGLKLKQK